MSLSNSNGLVLPSARDVYGECSAHGLRIVETTFCIPGMGTVEVMDIKDGDRRDSILRIAGVQVDPPRRPREGKFLGATIQYVTDGKSDAEHHIPRPGRNNHIALRFY